MIEQFGERCKDIVLSCVPASSATKNDTRYKAFCQRVCKLSGCINGFDHVRVLGARLKKKTDEVQWKMNLGCTLRIYNNV